MKLPNFFVVGAAKCGTTSVYEYLREHPQVFLPEAKELHFFAGPEHGSRLDEASYRRIFARADDYTAVGDTSTSYLYDEGAAARIRDALGEDVRIIVMLRNPVDMAYSLWGHRMRAGGEPLSFAEAIDAEPRRIADPEFRRGAIGGAYNYFYVDRARFAPQLRRYLDCFGRERVAVLLFEEFFSDVETGFGDLCRFLGVGDDFRPELRVHNPSGPPISAWLRDVVHERRPWKEPLKAVVPQSARSWLKTKLYWWNRRRGKKLPPLDHDLRERVWRELEPDVRQLERLLGRDLSRLWRRDGGGQRRETRTA